MKFVVNSLSEVPEPFHPEYESRNGKFYLKTEGDYLPLIEANTKLAEFRDNNRALNATKTELETKLTAFKDVDPAEYVKLKTKITELEAGGVKDKDSVAEMIKQAVKSATEPLTVKIAEREASEKAAQERLAEQGLENRLREVGTKIGIDERAIRDYIQRGKEVFKLVNGEPAARKGDQPIFSKAKPAEELSMEEWGLTMLQTDAPHLFKPSKGGGAGGDRATSGGFEGQRRYISSDPIEFGRNLEAIAKGEVLVQD